MLVKRSQQQLEDELPFFFVLERESKACQLGDKGPGHTSPSTFFLLSVLALSCFAQVVELGLRLMNEAFCRHHA